MNQEITEKMINDFYCSFETGYDFEFFLKRFLEDLGFSDIKVTKRSGDNGIDLIAYKNSIIDLDIDPEKYIIQAKRYKNTVPVKEIREFKGTASFEKRIFITTSDFSKSGYEEAEIDKQRKIVLINGESILKYYLEHPEKDYIFEWNPIVSKSKIYNLFVKNKLYDDNRNLQEEYILKLISKNDIRARILPIPIEIFEKIKEMSKYKVKIDDNILELKINKERRYFGGVTDIYRQKKYIDYDGIEKKKTYWRLEASQNLIKIIFE